jgi:uncharacterized membrane protein YbhN (UPF0104 family)
MTSTEPESEPETGEESPEPSGGLFDRILRARQASTNPWLLALAVIVFAGGTYLAIKSLPPIEQPVRWWLLLVVGFLCVPLVTILNALEFRLIARLAHHHPPILEIMQVTVLGSAANLLPIPGAVMVRLANLRQAGVRVAKGLNLTAIVGLAWLGTAGVLGGLFQITAEPGFAALAMSTGTALLVVSLTMLARALEPGTRLAAALELLVIEASFILAQAFRLFLIAAALRLDVSYSQAVTLVIATVAAAAIGFLPSGLGAREAIAAVLSPIIGLPASVGLLVTAVDRVLSLLVLTVLSGVITWLGRRSKRKELSRE